MENLDQVVKPGVLGSVTPKPWQRVDFDKDGRPASIWTRRVGGLLVRSKSYADCETSIQIPEGQSPTLSLLVRYRVSCPQGGEAEVGRALYDLEISPKAVLDKLVAQAARDYAAGPGAGVLEYFFIGTTGSPRPRRRFRVAGASADAASRASGLSGDQWIENVWAALSDALAQRIAILSRLNVERLSVEPKVEPAESIPINLTDRPVDLADNNRGPATVGVNLDLDHGSPRLLALAYLYAEREGELQRLVPEWLASFFRTVELERLLDETGLVEDELSAKLALECAERGRVVGRFTLGRPTHVVPVPVEDAFDCWLADGTSLGLRVRGALWFTRGTYDPQPGQSPAQDGLWTSLQPTLRARAETVLRGQVYRQFESDRKEILESILSAVRDDAARLGFRATLSIRPEWDHAWLLNGMRLIEEVECPVGKERAKGKVSVSLQCHIDWDAPMLWVSLKADQLEAAVRTLAKQIVHARMESVDLRQYLDFSEVKEKIEDELETAIRNQFGLTTWKQVSRIDDWHVQKLIELLREAPEIVISHPRVPELQFETQFRVIDTAVESGTPFPIYPTDIQQVTKAVEGCIRDFLSELPMAQTIGLARQQQLKQKIMLEIPKRMQAKYYLKIGILWWFARPYGGRSLEARIQEILFKLAQGGVGDWDRSEWIKELGRIAPQVEELGGYVPWIELEMHGVQRPAQEVQAGGETALLEKPKPPAGA